MGEVRLTFLGSGDAFASGGRFHACLHLDGGGEQMLVDCGPTALVALKRAGIDPAAIGWVALSHLHGDHFGGVPWVILDGQFNGRRKPLVIGGPPGTEERVRQAFAAFYPSAVDAEREFETRFEVLGEGQRHQLGPAAVTPFSAAHGSGAPAYALRVDYGGKVLAYSGDTEWTDSLVELARGADLFVCECNFYDTEAPQHLNFRTLAAKRDQLECERIVLTHMSDEMLAHVEKTGFEAATDGAVVAL